MKREALNSEFMRTFFIHSKINAETTMPKKLLSKLPKQKYAIFTNVQHLHKIKQLQNQLSNSIVGGQVLGCRPEVALKLENKVDAFLFVGSGVFHPLQVAIMTNKPVWLWDPATKILQELDKKIVKKHLKNKQSAYLNFLHSKNVGILVSTKIGQSDNKINTYSKELKMRSALRLKKRTDKNYYLFAFDTLQENDLENFPFVDAWVNTACNRISDNNNKILEIDDLLNFEKGESTEKNNFNIDINFS